MSNDTDRLEREAEAHRSNLDSTFEAIRDRLSVGQIVDELQGYVTRGQGAELTKNLGRQVRDNPLALGLVGAGIAWLFLGDGARRKSYETADRFERWREDRRYDRFEEAFPRDDHDRSPSRASVAGATSVSGSQGGPSGESATSRASSAVRNAGHSASERAGAASRSIDRGVHDAADRLSESGSSAWNSARDTGRRAYDAGYRGQRRVADLMHDEPLVFGAIALAVGAAVGAMLPATRREDEWMGETRDHLRDEAYEQGRETLHRAEDVATKAYESASEEAERKDLKPERGGNDETLAERVSDVARTGAETARTEAKKEGLS